VTNTGSNTSSFFEADHMNVLAGMSRTMGFGRTIRAGLQSLARIYRTTDLPRVRCDSSYSFGLPILDRRRETLVAIYTAFNEELRVLGGSSGSMLRVNKIANTLVSIIGEFFAFEETLMADTDYPGLDAHRIDHGRLLEDIERDIGRIQAQDADMYDLSHTIGSWLTKHMGKEDRPLADHLRCSTAVQSFATRAFATRAFATQASAKQAA